MLLQIPLLWLLFVNAHADCQTVADRDKRSFDELSPIVIDVDNDGKLDRILPRVLTLKPSLERHGPNRIREKKSHWIVFDLHTSKGRKLKSFFRFRYGSDWADYWVYALLPCDVNGDGKTDLIFYSGDDESDDTIILVNKNGRFVVSSRKHSEGDTTSYTRPHGRGSPILFPDSVDSQ